MVDPWNRLLEMLSGAFVVPRIVWPANSTRRVTVADDEELGHSPAEVEVLALLHEAPRSAVELAATLELKRGTVDVRMMRMARKGLVVHVGRAWGTAARAPRDSSNLPVRDLIPTN